MASQTMGGKPNVVVGMPNITYSYSYSYLVENLLFLGDPCIMAARMPSGSHKMIKWYEHWVITPFKMLKELIRSIDIFL